MRKLRQIQHQVALDGSSAQCSGVNAREVCSSIKKAYRGQAQRPTNAPHLFQRVQLHFEIVGEFQRALHALAVRVALGDRNLELALEPLDARRGVLGRGAARA